MPQSVYIHIPYCSAKCHYCSFVSFSDNSTVEKYLKSLDKEIEYFYENDKLKTLYIGGGTPSVLTVVQIENILKHFNYENNSQITIELNPENIDYDYLSKLRDTKINRISIGCQTFEDDILKLINRRHNSQKVINSVKAALKVGFKDISLDLIYGLPNQTIETFKNDIKKAIDLGIAHISLYGLKIDEGCYFYKKPPKNLPDDDFQADCYLAAIDILKNNGFKHYEVSNFSIPGFESKHNLAYWKNQEYYGFGVGAHGYKNGIRYENPIKINRYLDNPYQKDKETKLTIKEKLEEEIFLGLRIMDGIDVNYINQKYKIDFEKKYKTILNKYTQMKLLLRTEKGYCLSANGVLVSNVILADFLE